MAKYSIFKKIYEHDKSIIPYESNADHEITDLNYESAGIVILYGIYTPNIYRNNILPISSSLLRSDENINDNGYYYQSIHDSLKTYYYNLDSYLLRSNSIDLFLNEKSKVVSIPHFEYGEKIKEKSISITDYSNDFTSSYVDDGFGNIIDSNINTSSFVNSKYKIYYVGFNDNYDYKKYNSIATGSIYNINNYIYNYDKSEFSDTIGEFRNLNFIDGISCNDEPSSSGTQALFNGTDSYASIYHEYATSLKDATEFAIAFWGNFPKNQTDIVSEENVVLSKRYNETEYYLNKTTKKQEYKKNNKLNNVFPYEIGLYNQSSTNNGKLYFRNSNGNVTNELTSSVFVTGSQHHFLIQKTGSSIEMYIDGILNNDIVDNVGIKENLSDIYMGTLGNSKFLTGSLDEIYLYDNALTQNEIDSLSDNNYSSSSAYQTNVVGNVFYDEGLISMTSNFPKIPNTFDKFKLNYQSTITNYENNIICRVGKSDFNASLNPTLRKNNTEDSQEFKDFVTSSNFRTYITQIGLYDDYGRLLAIAKVPNPIQNRNDVNLNFFIKFDT